MLPTPRQNQSDNNNNNKQFEDSSRDVDGPANAQRLGQLGGDNGDSQQRSITESNLKGREDLGNEEEEDETDEGKPACG